MKTSIKDYSEPFFRSNILDRYFADLKVCVLDIETTGLSSEKNQLILGGLLLPQEDGNIRTIQFFAEELEDEEELLTAYTRILKDMDVYITYNGAAFDLPFLSRRCIKYGIEFSYSSAQSFDLFRIVKNFSDLKKLLPNLKQKSIENFLGLWPKRMDEISGGESVQLYSDYLQSHDKGLERILLLHNQDDLLQLARLLVLIKKLDLHRIMFHNGLILSKNSKKLYVEKIALFRNRIKVQGIQKNLERGYRCYQASHEAHVSPHSRQFLLKIPVFNEADSVFIDTSDFSIDLSCLSSYGGFQHGYLILQRNDQVCYSEINRLIQLILWDILMQT